MPARDLHDALVAEVAQLDGRVKEQLALVKADVESSLLPLAPDIEDYFDALLAEADAVWKLRILSEAKKRALEHVDRLRKDEAHDVASLPAELLNELKSALGWVVPRPVDPAVVAAVIARDRAADMAERAARGVGIEK